mmetsp:Transcript_15322/g.33505  ORF Transcript_15322/g.33505 Transcript_15322/m.33505 type:complete len:318 (-) Transcript_15322:326-1279(-)
MPPQGHPVRHVGRPAARPGAAARNPRGRQGQVAELRRGPAPRQRRHRAGLQRRPSALRGGRVRRRKASGALQVPARAARGGRETRLRPLVERRGHGQLGAAAPEASLLPLRGQPHPRLRRGQGAHTPHPGLEGAGARPHGLLPWHPRRHRAVPRPRRQLRPRRPLPDAGAPARRRGGLFLPRLLAGDAPAAGGGHEGDRARRALRPEADGAPGRSQHPLQHLRRRALPRRRGGPAGCGHAPGGPAGNAGQAPRRRQRRRPARRDHPRGAGERRREDPVGPGGRTQSLHPRHRRHDPPGSICPAALRCGASPEGGGDP